MSSTCCDIHHSPDAWESVAVELRPDDDWYGRIKLTLALMRESMLTRAESAAKLNASFGIDV